MADELSPQDKNRIWTSFGQAIGTEPREGKTITGASGLEHPVQSISVDDKHARLVIVSSEPNPRTAALMQVDIQATMPDVRVLLARPVVFDLGVIARKAFTTEASARIDLKTFNTTMERFEKLGEAKKSRYFRRQLGGIVEPMVRVFANVALPAASQIVDIAQQASYLDWREIFQDITSDSKNPAFSFAKLFEIDNLAIDRKNGVCPIPLFDFTEADWELFSRGKDIDQAKERLKELGVYQFFFPAADQLALGFVEKGLRTATEIIPAVERAPALGHPFSPNALTHSAGTLPEMLEQLKDQGYLAEGELGIEDTPEGRKIRSTIKFKPQESIFQRLLNRFSMNVSISPKDFMGPHS